MLGRQYSVVTTNESYNIKITVVFSGIYFIMVPLKYVIIEVFLCQYIFLNVC